MTDQPLLTADQVLAWLQYPGDKIKADIAKLALNFPDGQIPLDVAVTWFRNYWSEANLRALATLCLSEWGNLLREGASEIAPSEADNA